MSNRNHRLRSIGLVFVSSLVLLAIGAASAQATGNWRINGVNIAAEKQIVSEEDTMFLFLIPAVNIEILCNQFELDEGKLLLNGGSLAKLLFKQCETFSMALGLERIAVCDPAGGNITLLAKDLLILHNNKTYDLFTPDVEPNFGAVAFNVPCTLPAVVQIKGSFIVEDCSGLGLENEAVRHLIQQAPAALFPGVTLKFGANEMRLDGSAWLRLGGAEVGKNWSGLT